MQCHNMRDIGRSRRLVLLCRLCKKLKVEIISPAWDSLAFLKRAFAYSGDSQSRRNCKCLLHRGKHDIPAEPVEMQRSEEHTSELQSRLHLVCRLLLENTILSSAQRIRSGQARGSLGWGHSGLSG